MPHSLSMETDIDLPADITTTAVTSLLTHVLCNEGIEEEWTLGIQFVDDATMQAAHVEFMDIDEPTDIMTFPYADEDDVWGDSEPGGDLIISVDTARENAEVAEWSVSDELYFLITHGILHLLGWDDHAADTRAAMLERQQLLLKSWADRP